MTKILLLANNENTIYNFRLELIDELIKNNYDVHVAFPIGGERTKIIKSNNFVEYHNIAIKYLNNINYNLNPIKEIKLFYEIKKLIKKIKPNYILSFTLKPNIYGGYFASKFYSNHIANITGLGKTKTENLIKKFIVKKLYGFGFKKTDMVFFQNHSDLEYFQNLNIRLNNFKVIPGSGVNLKRFVYKEKIERNVFKFYFIGRLIKEKGLDLFINLSKKMKCEYDNIEFHLVGEASLDIICELNKLENKNILIYHGKAHDVRTYLEDADCVINPTLYSEGMNNVILEAFATGTPVIATNKSGCKEIIENEINGYLFKENSFDDMYTYAKKIISLNFKDRLFMGVKAREKSLVFDRDIIVNLYLEEILKYRRETL